MKLTDNIKEIETIQVELNDWNEIIAMNRMLADKLQKYQQPAKPKKNALSDAQRAKLIFDKNRNKR